MRQRVRVLVAVCVVLLASGCLASPSSQPEATDAPVPLVDPIWDTTDMLPFISGTYRWHDPTADAFGGAYTQATQAAVHPCLFQADGEDRATPYFNNLNLTPAPPEQYVPVGTTHLDMTLTWGPTDWTGTELYVAYIGGSAEFYRVAGPIPNNTPFSVDLNNNTWDNGTVSNWDVWVCLANGQGVGDEDPFIGELVVDIQVARRA